MVQVLLRRSESITSQHFNMLSKKWDDDESENPAADQFSSKLGPLHSVECQPMNEKLKEVGFLLPVPLAQNFPAGLYDPAPGTLK